MPRKSKTETKVSNKAVKEAEAVATGSSVPLALEMVTNLKEAPDPRTKLVSYEEGVVGGLDGIRTRGEAGVGMMSKVIPFATKPRSYGQVPFAGPYY